MIALKDTIPWEIEDGENEPYEAIVHYRYTPGTPESGRYSGPPEDYDPGSGPEIELLFAVDEDGRQATIPPSQWDAIETYITENPPEPIEREYEREYEV